MTVRKRVRQVLRSDTKAYALVEEKYLGLVTVRLGANGTGSRITNIPFTGNIQEGDTVIVDHSVNSLMVRPYQPIEDEPELELNEAEHSPTPGSFGKDFIAAGRVQNTKNISASTWLNSNYGMPFDTVVYDTADEWTTHYGYFNSLPRTSYLIKPFESGVYHISAAIGLSWLDNKAPTADWRFYMSIRELSFNSYRGSNNYEYYSFWAYNYSYTQHGMYLDKKSIVLWTETLFRLTPFAGVGLDYYYSGPTQQVQLFADSDLGIPYMQWVRLSDMGDEMTAFPKWWFYKYYEAPWY